MAFNSDLLNTVFCILDSVRLNYEVVFWGLKSYTPPFN